MHFPAWESRPRRAKSLLARSSQADAKKQESAQVMQERPCSPVCELARIAARACYVPYVVRAWQGQTTVTALVRAYSALLKVTMRP